MCLYTHEAAKHELKYECSNKNKEFNIILIVNVINFTYSYLFVSYNQFLMTAAIL